MKVIVCGGRDATDQDHIFMALDWMHERNPITRLAAGDQDGVDTFALNWAFYRQVPFRKYVAKWTKLGKAAGPIRNRIMLQTEEPDWVIAFPGGEGTNNMIKIARKKGVKIIRIGEGLKMTDEPMQQNLFGGG